MSDNPVPPPAGYYDDGTGQQRYWDGQRWAEAPVAVPAQGDASTAQQNDQQAQHVALQQPGYGPPQSVGYPPVAAPADKHTNVLGIVAFCVAIVGFIFACIPGALIVGWIALPIAFILSIVALFLKGKGKALALTGLIVSVVGTIVGFVVFFAVVANALGTATGSTITQPKSHSSASNEAKSGTDNEAASGAVGTRKNPAAIGSQIKSGDYTVTVNSVNLNANDQVAAANEFNDEPDPGTAYALVNVTVSYSGQKSGDTSLIGISYVTASGNVIESFDKLAVGPDPQFSGQELYAGASATGNVVLDVPVGDNGLIRVRPGILADEIFVKTH